MNRKEILQLETWVYILLAMGFVGFVSLLILFAYVNTGVAYFILGSSQQFTYWMLVLMTVVGSIGTWHFMARREGLLTGKPVDLDKLRLHTILAGCLSIAVLGLLPILAILNIALFDLSSMDIGDALSKLFDFAVGWLYIVMFVGGVIGTWQVMVRLQWLKDDKGQQQLQSKEH